MIECENQMTLGDLIDRLNQIDKDTVVKCRGELDSYRGYYEDLFIEPSSTGTKASDLAEICERAVGKVFTGYKGGEFRMDVDTPIFVAYYGSTGLPLVSVLDNGDIETGEEE